jgi:hypothetical protein
MSWLPGPKKVEVAKPAESAHPAEPSKTAIGQAVNA